MSKRTGVSAEEKLSRMINFFHSSVRSSDLCWFVKAVGEQVDVWCDKIRITTSSFELNIDHTHKHHRTVSSR